MGAVSYARAMTPGSEYVTVYRSADTDAEADANTARDRLVAAGLDAIVVGDDMPGVVVGTYEVRVPGTQAVQAEEILGPVPPEADDEHTPIDPSHDLDLVAVFGSQAVDAELEAQAIRGILEANEIPAFIVGSAQIPVVPLEVRVPRSRLEEAREAIAHARESGPSAAEEEERESEASAGESEQPV